MATTKTDKPVSTRKKLAVAALSEFNKRGFEGTNSNKIARSAGFAPQTFYRTFSNKSEAFVAAYEVWQQDEALHLNASVHAGDKHSTEVAESLLAFHRKYRVFRASLSRLAADQPLVAAARAMSRASQVQRIAKGQPAIGNDPARILAGLLAVEATADAVVDGLFDIYCPQPSDAIGLVADAVQPLMPLMWQDIRSSVANLKF